MAGQWANTRILHVLDHSAPLHSGYTFRTLALIGEQEKRGWEPLLLTGPKQASGTLEVEDVGKRRFFRTPDSSERVLRFPVLGELAIMRAIETRIEAIVQQWAPDVIHAHSPVLNVLPALRVGRRHHLPVVYEVRAFWEDAAVEHGTSRPNDLRYRATRALETFALKRVDSVTTICDGLRDAIAERGVSRDRITVIPNGVDVQRFSTVSQRDESLADELGLANDYVLGFAGSFYRYEGLDIAIQAMASPALRDRPIKLLLVGGGPEYERLRSLVDHLELRDRVVFTGRVAHEQIDRYYGVMNLMVFPRLRHRLTELVTPLKPLEAMAQGKLVLASDVGGHRELVSDRHTGFLFTPESSDAFAEAVLRLVAQPASELDNIRHNARRFVEEERNWEKSVSHYVVAYRKAGLSL